MGVVVATPIMSKLTLKHVTFTFSALLYKNYAHNFSSFIEGKLSLYIVIY